MLILGSLTMDDRKYFHFDGQLHIPPDRIKEALEFAIRSELNAIAFTNYGNTNPFDCLARNRDDGGLRVIGSSMWDIQQKSGTVLKVSSPEGHIFVLKGEEVKTRQGHVLAWGIDRAIEGRLDIKDTLEMIYHQGGVAVFSHLLVKLFHGCGMDVFDKMYQRFGGYPIGVEKNGQISPLWDIIFGPNRRVLEIAEERGVACFGTSDIHGAYGGQVTNIGARYYTSIPLRHIDPDKMRGSLAEVMISKPEVVQVDGGSNSFLETAIWNLQSL